jgi:hypothetical protein
MWLCSCVTCVEVEFHFLLSLLSWYRNTLWRLVRVNRSVRNLSARFRCLFERVGKCPIEAGVIVVEKMS